MAFPGSSIVRKRALASRLIWRNLYLGGGQHSLKRRRLGRDLGVELRWALGRCTGGVRRGEGEHGYGRVSASKEVCTRPLIVHPDTLQPGATSLCGPPRAVELPGGITPPPSIFADQLCELVMGSTYHGSIRSMTERRARLPVSCHTTTREPSSEGGGSTLHPRWRRSVRPTGRAASLLVRHQPAHRKSVEPRVKNVPRAPGC